MTWVKIKPKQNLAFIFWYCYLVPDCVDERRREKRQTSWLISLALIMSKQWSCSGGGELQAPSLHTRQAPGKARALGQKASGSEHLSALRQHLVCWSVEWLTLKLLRWKGYSFRKLFYQSCSLECSPFSDINECALNTRTCSPHANCLNTQGSFKCKCKQGYRGNGLQCSGK